MCPKKICAVEICKDLLNQGLRDQLMDSLPNEIIVEIFGFLTNNFTKNLLNFLQLRQISQQFYSLINEILGWKMNVMIPKKLTSFELFLVGRSGYWNQEDCHKNQNFRIICDCSINLKQMIPFLFESVWGVCYGSYLWPVNLLTFCEKPYPFTIYDENIQFIEYDTLIPIEQLIPFLRLGKLYVNHLDRLIRRLMTEDEKNRHFALESEFVEFKQSIMTFKLNAENDKDNTDEDELCLGNDQDCSTILILAKNYKSF